MSRWAVLGGILASLVLAVGCAGEDEESAEQASSQNQPAGQAKPVTAIDVKGFDKIKNCIGVEAHGMVDASGDLNGADPVAAVAVAAGSMFLFEDEAATEQAVTALRERPQTQRPLERRANLLLRIPTADETSQENVGRWQTCLDDAGLGDRGELIEFDASTVPPEFAELADAIENGGWKVQEGDETGGVLSIRLTKTNPVAGPIEISKQPSVMDARREAKSLMEDSGRIEVDGRTRPVTYAISEGLFVLSSPQGPKQLTDDELRELVHG